MWDLIVSVPDHCLSFYFPNHGKETETQMVWPHLKIPWHGDNSRGESERPSINIFKHLPQNILEPKHIRLSGLHHPVIR